MNLYLEATREVTVNKTGKISTQTSIFNLWQTPTKVTYAALESKNTKEFYIDWCNTVSKNIIEPVYAADDLFGENKPIGENTYNTADEHIKDIEEWLDECESEGYEIEWSII